ncbi:MAG: DUF1428 family protein [Pseudomonadota bacterium]
MRHAAASAEVHEAYGAVNLVACCGDDAQAGERTPCVDELQREPDETGVFSWIWWLSMTARDVGMAAAVQDERPPPGRNPMPFDGNQMILAGFDVVGGAEAWPPQCPVR